MVRASGRTELREVADAEVMSTTCRGPCPGTACCRDRTIERPEVVLIKCRQGDRPKVVCPFVRLVTFSRTQLTMQLKISFGV